MCIRLRRPFRTLTARRWRSPGSLLVVPCVRPSHASGDMAGGFSRSLRSRQSRACAWWSPRPPSGQILRRASGWSCSPSQGRMPNYSLNRQLQRAIQNRSQRTPTILPRCGAVRQTAEKCRHDKRSRSTIRPCASAYADSRTSFAGSIARVAACIPADD
jgi:hypothetical protein